MSTYSGEPAISENNLPTAKNITSTTNATPIVVTTSTTHGIQTGSYVRVEDSDATAANGDWIAGTVTTNQVTLLVIPTGANSVGTGVGSAVGTITDLGFGVQATLPDDTTDDMDAGSVNVPFEEVLDRTAWLKYRENVLSKGMGLGRTIAVQQPWVVDPDAGGANESHFGVATVDKGKRAKVALDLPDGSVLTQMRVYIFPASPHGALPGTMPTLSLVKWSATGGAGTVITTGTDGSASVVAYETLHELVFTLSPTVKVDRNEFVYYLEFNQEDDPNALNGGAVLQPRVHINY